MRSYVPFALLAFAAGTSALAQPTGTAPTAPAAGVPKHNCTSPGPIPGEMTGTDSKMRQYSKDYIAYTDCLKKFALDEQKAAEPHMKAANDAVAEYNAAVKTYNEEVQRRKDGK
jgi:hypothetical protein